MKNEIFKEYGQYYDLLYHDKDYQAESDYVASLLTRFGVGGTNLLELGSGTGVHAGLLARRGYNIVGIEQSPEMATNAQTTPGFTCIQADICSVHLERKFDAVLSLFHVLSYQVTNAELDAVFNRAAEHLDVGGLFVFDFWYSAAVYTQRPTVRVKRVTDHNVEIIRIAEPYLRSNENRVDVNYTIFVRDIAQGTVRTFREVHRMRHFSLPELAFIAKITGFELINSEEFMTGKAPSEDTWGVCVVLKKVA